VLAERLLMMPGARAEILLENQGARRTPATLALRTAGLAASREPVRRNEEGEAAVLGEVAGDVWPALDLARIILPAQEAGPTLTWPATARISAPAAPGPVPVAASTMPGCSILPPDTAENRWHRRITFSKTGSDESERFQMGMRIHNQLGQEFSTLFPEATGAIGRGWEPEAWEPHGGAAGQHAAPHNLICPVLGRPEVWVVANASSEMHNLHLHQGRFRLARPTDPGAPDALAAQGPVTDPTNTLAGLFSAGAAQRLAWHDSLPVAPWSLPDAAGARMDGTTTLYMPFFAAEQEGLYPVHCHILEHEDKGMMAAIMVLPGAQPAAAAAASDATLLAALLDPNGRLPASCVAP
jgi:FtsP/CotA-like multicopper oxidase with cupredoxin domain